MLFPSFSATLDPLYPAEVPLAFVVRHSLIIRAIKAFGDPLFGTARMLESERSQILAEGTRGGARATAGGSGGSAKIQ